MMTKDQYIDSLRGLHLNLYSFGKKVENVVDNPIVRPSLNSFAATYELAEDPQYEDLMTATSNLTGKKVNRFTHLHQSTDDLIKKVKMQRLLGQKTAACFQRCVGMDAANAVYSTTFETDEACGTKYHENFVKFWTDVPRRSACARFPASAVRWTLCAAQTCPRAAVPSLRCTRPPRTSLHLRLLQPLPPAVRLPPAAAMSIILSPSTAWRSFAVKRSASAQSV